MEDEMIHDDILFEKHPTGDGWISKMFTPNGDISVRYGGSGTMSEDKSLYEVWYPNEDEPVGDQTAENIWNYLKSCYEK